MTNQSLIFTVIIGLVVMQRLIELVIAKNNEKWLRSQGAIEYGRSHYKYIVALHTVWFVSMIVEYVYRYSVSVDKVSVALIAVFVFSQGMRVWVLLSLGKFWNTKILVVPNVRLVNKGLYKFIKHPNYVIVAIELLVLPLAFHLPVTAIIFSLFNAMMMYVRIRIENRALSYNQ